MPVIKIEKTNYQAFPLVDPSPKSMLVCILLLGIFFPIVSAIIFTILQYYEYSEAFVTIMYFVIGNFIYAALVIIGLYVVSVILIILSYLCFTPHQTGLINLSLFIKISFSLYQTFLIKLKFYLLEFVLIQLPVLKHKFLITYIVYCYLCFLSLFLSFMVLYVNEVLDLNNIYGFLFIFLKNYHFYFSSDSLVDYDFLLVWKLYIDNFEYLYLFQLCEENNLSIPSDHTLLQNLKSTMANLGHSEEDGDHYILPTSPLYTSCEAGEGIHKSNNLSNDFNLYNHQHSLDSTPVLTSSNPWKTNKYLLHQDYLSGKDYFNDSDPQPPKNDNNLTPHIKEDSDDKDNKNEQLKTKEIIVKKTTNTVMMVEIAKREDWVYGWSLYDAPGVRCFLGIYTDYDLNPGFFTDKGDFYIPGKNYGFFQEQMVYRDLEGNIVPENRIHYNSRPKHFTGKILRPPVSPF